MFVSHAIGAIIMVNSLLQLIDGILTLGVAAMGLFFLPDYPNNPKYMCSGVSLIDRLIPFPALCPNSG